MGLVKCELIIWQEIELEEKYRIKIGKNYDKQGLLYVSMDKYGECCSLFGRSRRFGAKPPMM